MLQRLPIALSLVKAGNASRKLLNEIVQIIYSFYQVKEMTKKVYNRKSKRYNTKTDAIFMNSGNVKTSDPLRLLFNFSDKISLKRSDKYVAL